MNKYLVFVIVILIFALTGTLGYFIFQNQKLIKTLSSPSASPSAMTESKSQASPTSTPKTSPQPSPQDIRANIEAAVNSKNFAAIGTYTTTPKVNFSIMSSGCCEPKTPDEVVAQMDYIKDGIPMDFDQNNPKIVHIKAKKPEFANAFIGVSKSGEQVAIFVIDANNKISAIQLSLSYTFYDF